MKQLVVAALAVAGITGSAFAADLPSRKEPFVTAPLPPVFTWTGFYVGVNAGYAFNHESRFRTFDDPAAGTPIGGGFFNTAGGVAAGTRPGVASVGDDGFTGGGQIGYNYQFGAGSGIVIGVEADAAYTDIDNTSAYFAPGPGFGYNSVFHSQLDFLGTARGRIGYAFDRFLIYGTGGFAYGSLTTNANFYGTNGTLAYTGGQDGIETGYAYGGGIEYALPVNTFLNFFGSSAVTIKAEYLHYDLGDRSYGLGGTGVSTASGLTNPNFGTYTQRVRTDGDLVRIGVNYKF